MGQPRLRTLKPRVATLGTAPSLGSGWSREGRGSRHQRGYGAKWDKLRLLILRRDNGLCQCDECQGGKLRLTEATEVHHIMGKAKARQLGWTEEQIDDPGNLAAINSECHKRETAKDSAEARRGY